MFTVKLRAWFTRLPHIAFEILEMKSTFFDVFAAYPAELLVFATCMTNGCPVNRFSHLNCRSLQHLHGYHESLGCLPVKCFPFPAIRFNSAHSQMIGPTVQVVVCKNYHFFFNISNYTSSCEIPQKYIRKLWL